MSSFSRRLSSQWIHHGRQSPRQEILVTQCLTMCSGSFHIAVGQSHSEQGEKHHHHWDAPLRQLGFNTTHYIHHFSFGTEYPGMVNPLDGTLFVESGLGQKQYFFQVVPTTFIKANGRKIQTNQYSVSEHYNPINLNAENIELPGIHITQVTLTNHRCILQVRYFSHTN